MLVFVGLPAARKNARQCGQSFPVPADEYAVNGVECRSVDRFQRKKEGECRPRFARFIGCSRQCRRRVGCGIDGSFLNGKVVKVQTVVVGLGPGVESYAVVAVGDGRERLGEGYGVASYLGRRKDDLSCRHSRHGRFCPHTYLQCLFVIGAVGACMEPDVVVRACFQFDIR